MTEDGLLAVVRSAWISEFGHAPMITTTWEESGGDSVQLMSFLLELEKLTGKEVPLELLSLEMTSSSLAHDLAILYTSKPDGADQTAVIPLVFLMPFLAGDHHSLARFRAELKGKVRFELVDHPSWHKMIEMGGDFNAIVDAATEKILAANVVDKYFLVGESFGGFVAWEVARRLFESGRRVGLVGLLDVRPPSLVSSVRSRSGPWQTIQNLRLRPKDTILSIFLDPLVEYLPLPLIKAIRRAVQLLPSSEAFRLSHRLVKVFRMRALNKLTLRPLEVPTVLFRSADLLAESPDYGWMALCPELKIIPIGGDHVIVDEEHSLKILCEKFLESITTAVSIFEPSSASLSSTGVVGHNRAAA